MSRSSIFSSSTLQVRCRLSAALVVAASAFLLLEFGVCRRDWLFRLFSESAVGEVFQKEQRLRALPCGPRIVIFGDSRSRDAFDELAIEGGLGLPSGTVANLSLSGGTPFDARLLLRRNRELIGRARLVIYGISELDHSGVTP